MRAALPETTITKTGVQQINVGEVKVGPISIARLVLSDLHVESSTGVARLRNVITTITLQFSLDWKVGVTIDTIGRCRFQPIEIRKSGLVGVFARSRKHYAARLCESFLRHCKPARHQRSSSRRTDSESKFGLCNCRASSNKSVKRRGLRSGREAYHRPLKIAPPGLRNSQQS